jgi:hypothetical protein
MVCILFLLVAIVLYVQTATVFASENGLKVTVEDSKCVLANAFIQAALFQEFSIREEQIIFRINLTVLMVCLFNYFLMMSYSESESGVIDGYYEATLVSSSGTKARGGSSFSEAGG